METVYLLLGEYDGRKWEHTIETEIYANLKDARKALKENFEESKNYLLENCDEDDIEIEYQDADSFLIQSDDFDHWAEYSIHEKKIN